MQAQSRPRAGTRNTASILSLSSAVKRPQRQIHVVAGPKQQESIVPVCLCFVLLLAIIAPPIFSLQEAIIFPVGSGRSLSWP